MNLVTFALTESSIVQFYIKMNFGGVFFALIKHWDKYRTFESRDVWLFY